MFSDPDEIPNPKILANLKLKKKYGIFLQQMYCYKFNLYNKYESPWEGTKYIKEITTKAIGICLEGKDLTSRKIFKSIKK